VIRGSGAVSTLEFFEDVPGYQFIGFPMIRHRLVNTCVAIHIPTMFAAVADEQTSGVLKLPDQVRVLHPSDSSATRRTPGILPLVRSP